MSLPQQNCTVSSIRAQGQPGEMGLPDSTGDETWAGSEPGYYREKRERVFDGQTSSYEVVRSLIVATSFAANIGRGMVVALDWGGTDVTGQVSAIERFRIDDPSVPDELQTTRVTFERT